jgi:hypothetical protein
MNGRIELSPPCRLPNVLQGNQRPVWNVTRFSRGAPSPQAPSAASGGEAAVHHIGVLN